MNTYKTARIGKNNRVVSFTEGKLSYEILISYDVPVAYFLRDNNGLGFIERTATRWSRSTESQIQKWCRSKGLYDVEAVPQKSLDDLLLAVIGDTRLEETRNTDKEAPRAYTKGVDYEAHTEQGDKNLVVPVYRRH